MTQTDTGTLLEVILGEIRELKTDVHALDKAIRGNGTPGLNQRVAAIEDRLKWVAGALLAGLPIALDWIRRQLGWH